MNGAESAARRGDGSAVAASGAIEEVVALRTALVLMAEDRREVGRKDQRIGGVIGVVELTPVRQLTVGESGF